jgi:protein subunit release factor B
MPLPDHLQRLLAECEVETFRGSGPGGQHRNKTESAVRVRHRPSGLTRLGTEHRSQLRNRELALTRLYEALAARARRPKPRVATRPPRAAAEKRLGAKRQRAEVKRARRGPAED